MRDEEEVKERERMRDGGRKRQRDTCRHTLRESLC